MAWEAASRGVDLKLVSQYVLQWASLRQIAKVTGNSLD